MVLLAGRVLETQSAGGVFNGPEMKGINGVLGQRKSVGLRSEVDRDRLAGAGLAVGASDVEAVQELRQLRNRVQRPHDPPVGQHRAGPGGAGGAGYRETAVGEEMLCALLRVLANVVEQPQIAAGPENAAPGGVAQGQLDGRRDGQRAGGDGAQAVLIVAQERSSQRKSGRSSYWGM